MNNLFVGDYCTYGGAAQIMSHHIAKTLPGMPFSRIPRLSKHKAQPELLHSSSNCEYNRLEPGNLDDCLGYSRSLRPVSELRHLSCWISLLVIQAAM